MKSTGKIERLIDQIQNSVDDDKNTVEQTTKIVPPVGKVTEEKKKKRKVKKSKEKYVEENLEYTLEMQRIDQVKRVMGLDNDDDNDGSDNNKKIVVKQKVKEKKKEIDRNLLLIIFLILLIIVAGLSVYLAIDIQNNKKKVTSSEARTISKEAYESIIYDYGQAATTSVKNYLSLNQKIPTFDEIEETIYYPIHSVKCKKSLVNYDGSIYLSGCKIEGYDSQYRYEYGEQKEEIKTSTDEIYVYQYAGTDYPYYYVSSTLYDIDDNQKLVDTYSCVVEGCSGYSSFTSAKQIVIYDGQYLFYNPETKEKLPISSIGKEKYKAITPIVDGNQNIVALFLINSTGKGAYYITKKEQIITDFQYDADTSDSFLISKGYFAANRIEKKDMSVFIIHGITGEEIYQFKDAYSIYSEKVGDKNLYYATSSYFGDRIGYYITDTFERLISDKEKYSSVINTDSTITIIDNQKFKIYNSNGELVFNSKKYDEVLKVIKDYVIIENNDEVQIVNLKGEKIVTLLAGKDTYTYHPLISGFSQIGGKDAIVFIVEDKEMDEGIEGRGLKYYYILETNEVGVLKTTGIGK